MAHENPGRFQNVPDSDLYSGEAITDVDFAKMVGNQRHLYERTVNAAAGETQQVIGHAHGELSPECGLVKRRSIHNQSYVGASATYAVFTVNAAWQTLDVCRCPVGPFLRVFSEVRYLVSSDAVKFRLTRYDWVDSGNAVTQTQGIQEQTADKNSTSAVWHTIDGQLWNGAAYAGTDTKLCTIDWDGDITDLGECCALAEFRLDAYASASSTSLALYNWCIHEALTTDEDTDGWLD